MRFEIDNQLHSVGKKKLTTNRHTYEIDKWCKTIALHRVSVHTQHNNIEKNRKKKRIHNDFDQSIGENNN